jgi:catechol 2,3-dioxygenase-like lactoylglutathione lyase family enzyme
MGLPMFDHLSIWVTDYAKSKAFYERALAPLGITVQMEFGNVAGFGRGGKPSFWIGEGTPAFWGKGHRAGAAPVHIALAVENRAQVEAFYQAALVAGATDHGAPGLRPQYHPGYYGAFVLDPDGNNVEAVCHEAG